MRLPIVLVLLLPACSLDGSLAGFTPADTGSDPETGSTDARGDTAPRDTASDTEADTASDTIQPPDSAGDTPTDDVHVPDTRDTAPPDLGAEDIPDRENRCEGVECSQSGGGCKRGMCDPETGDCVYEPKPDRTTCDGGFCLDGQCVECFDAGDCSRPGVCYRRSCRGNQCQSNLIDDGTTCVDRRETSGYCRRGICSDCSMDAHCRDPDAPHCADGTCAECADSGDCRGDLDECLHWVCSGARCQAVGDTGASCDGGDGICFTDRCVECYLDEHCESGNCAQNSCEDDG